MKFDLRHISRITGLFGWLSQIVKLSQNRYRAQVRLFALAAAAGMRDEAPPLTPYDTLDRALELLVEAEAI